MPMSDQLRVDPDLARRIAFELRASSFEELDPATLRATIRAALLEDGAHRDVTTLALVPPAQRGSGVFVAKAVGVVCGLPIVAAVFAQLDPAVCLEPLVAEGAAVSSGEALARVEGPLAPILSGERVALNLLQHLSGVATATRALVDAIAGLDARILDTRKTTPGLRALERCAVRIGGGDNHRFSLSDGVLIKDNHLAAARSRSLTIAQVIEQSRRAAPGMLIEIEVTTVDEAREAVDAGVGVVLLDNMPVDEMRKVVAFAKGRALLEASGGVTLANVRAIAETGVDRISVGGITHSAPALDISLELDVTT